jgi:hypothetical protein
MRVKIRGGTGTDGSTPLCYSCRWATIARGPRLGDEIISCSRLSDNHGRIRFPVVSCTAYTDRRLTSLHDMEDLAWVLRSDNRRKQIGFVRARDLKPVHRYVLDDDDWR